ncbi:hypothetical protein Sps_04833 [Shewanella psychrophila]|uniref:Uncharacterized protein n=1 Tax=Shewanella psychrophila TaxID=225848 RepID=A0A1S6HWH8_9GAMM|nr:hypothetical protein [Shewanella psychrophila]AQS39915.1 hypothetical protein Sps_04833 [Shewanella psychrophila]
MEIKLSKAKLYVLVAAISAVLMGGAAGAFLYKDKASQKEARQLELRKIDTAKKNYLSLIETIGGKLSFPILDYIKMESELSNVNFLGWNPVELKCQTTTCDYTLNTDNQHYVGIPNIAMGYQDLNIVMSGNNLMIKGINLLAIDNGLDELTYKGLPLCTDSLSDMRKFTDIAGFSLSRGGSANASSFAFQQPVSLVKEKKLLIKGKADYLDVYGIDWNAQGFDKMKINYLFRYIFNNKNVGVSAIRKVYEESNLGYSMTGTIYCKAN